VFGNFKQSQVLTSTILSNVIHRQSNGYTHSTGAPVARAAVAKRYCTSSTTYESSDVVIASGGSGALDLAISVLVDENTNILVPRPGFPLYETIAVARGVRNIIIYLETHTYTMIYYVLTGFSKALSSLS